jgi:hypothetical protein
MEEQNKVKGDSRREFLKKAGKLAVYTPPAMVAMMQPGYASFALSGGVGLKCNNGLGQRVLDCQPPGLQNKPELWNDLPSSVPGNPNAGPK